MFDGYSTTPDGAPTLQAGDPYVIKPGEQLYAQWLVIVNLAFSRNAGDATGTDLGPYSGKDLAGVSVPDNPYERKGWTFSSWNTEADGSGRAYAPGVWFPAPYVREHGPRRYRGGICAHVAAGHGAREHAWHNRRGSWSAHLCAN